MSLLSRYPTTLNSMDSIKIRKIMRKTASFLSLSLLLQLFGLLQATQLEPRALPPLALLPAMKDPCQSDLKLTPELWMELGIDQYMAEIPNLSKMTVAQYTASINATNFFCGIGLSCLAGQICYPVRGRDWIILYAIQEWNNYMNSLYQAVEDAISLMRDASSEIVADFMPLSPKTGAIFAWSAATISIGVLATFTALLVPALLPAKASMTAVRTAGTVSSMGKAAEEAYRTAMIAKNAGKVAEVAKIQETQDAVSTIDKFKALFDQMSEKAAKAGKHLPKNLPKAVTPPEAAHDFQVAFKAASPSGSKSLRKRGISQRTHWLEKRGHWLQKRTHKPPPSAFAYTRWAELDTHLTAIQNRLQRIIAATVKLGLTTPIYTDEGLALSLYGGNFLSPLPSQTELRNKARDLARITAISEFFKSINMFITIGCDPCDDSGPNGTRSQDNYLSYCSEQRIQHNIVRAEGIDVRNKFNNAHWLKEKYNYDTKDLILNAINCQNLYGFYTLNNYPPPETAQSNCTFTLPVCDCSRPEVAHIRGKKDGTVSACRRGLNLPI